VTISCDQDQEIEASQNDRVSTLVEVALTSSKFQNLNISVSELDIKKAKYINADENSIAIPFVGYADKKAIITIFNKENSILAIAAYEAITNVPADQIYEELKNGSFNGTFEFKMEIGEMKIEMLKSKIISKAMTINNPVAKCNGWSEPGGPLDCAGARLENMNWWDAGWCYATFGYCMAQLAISCWIDDCVVK
jgi:hypothetical protein